MKLIIWRIQKTSDSECYSIIAKTKKDALAQYENNNNGFDFCLEKVEFEFENTFDFFEQITGECGGRMILGKTLSEYLIRMENGKAVTRSSDSPPIWWNK